jgi:hypothetical protein
MFRQLARLIYPGTPPPTPQQAAETVLSIHPMQLSRFLEEVWEVRNPNLLTPTGLEIPATVSQLALERDSGIVGLIPSANSSSYPPTVWDHLIYAYMVENTRLYEIFRRVLEEYAYGERLSVASEEGQRWLRTTEQLFYRDNPPFQIYSLSSWVRPDMRAVRRNAYHRMFGVDLNHGTDDNRPYPYPRAAAANLEFVTTFEGLLREVWRAIENVRNSSGPNATDISTIANLARTLYDMLRVRRQENSGNLARDELFHVSTMTWFHLTLSYDTPIVVDLKAQATSAAERLQKIGERVGLPAHSRADSYFRLASSMSLLLREIELGTFNTAGGAPGLYSTTTYLDAIQETITHWSIATGRDVKSAKVSIAAPTPTPVRQMPRPIVGAQPSSNGRAAVNRELIPS